MPERQGAVRIDFPALSWQKVQGGGAAGRMKRYSTDDEDTIRILEISPKWREAEWCTRGHVGYVIAGRVRLDFAGQRPFEVGRGQGFHIPEGCAHRASCKRRTSMFIVD